MFDCDRSAAGLDETRGGGKLGLEISWPKWRNDSTPPRVPPLVLASEGFLLAIAVGAEESEVLAPVVGSVAVDMIQDQDQRPLPPERSGAAFGTKRDQNAFLEQTGFKATMNPIRGVLHQNLGKRQFGRPGMRFSPKMALPGKMRGIQAQAYKVPLDTLVIAARRRKV
jgi:hypothetical protein